MLYCIKINNIYFNFKFLLICFIILFCSTCILYSLWFFISTTTIWFVKTWNATEVLRSFLYIGRFPLSSFSFSLRIFFSVFIPIAFITTIPSEVFLGVATYWKIILEVIISSIFLITSRKFWLFALRFYTSASSRNFIHNSQIFCLLVIFNNLDNLLKLNDDLSIASILHR